MRAPTATVVVTASIAPKDDPPGWIGGGGSSDHWLTEGYGDLREVDAYSPTSGDLLPASVFHDTSLRVRLRIEQWSFQEVCVPIGDEGNEETCSDEWVRGSVAESVARQGRQIELEYELDGTETIATYLVDNTAPLPPTLTAQATVPTGRWIQVGANVAAEAICEGAESCNLDVYTNEPMQLAITSPDGSLVAWHGIAGLTRVPEPAHGAALATIVLAALRSRRRA